MTVDIKNEIDMELKEIHMNEELKKKIRKKTTKRPAHRYASSIAAALAIVIFSGTTVFAGYYVYNKIMVNEEVLPELDDMNYLKTNHLNLEADEYGMINAKVDDYENIQKELGVELLESDLAVDDSYLLGTIETDNKDFAMITLNNYIIGDTTNYQYLSEEGFYEYKHGEEYYSPVSLTIDIMLSQEQEENGWERDYLGLYQFKDNYVSAQGYKVNLVEDMTDEEKVDDYVSEKCAIFVVDGVRYTLKGRTSFENMKNIVDTMKY